MEIIDGVMTFRLIDQELENIKLVDKAIELWAQNGCPGACSREEAVLKITFGDLDGAVLSFPPQLHNAAIKEDAFDACILIMDTCQWHHWRTLSPYI